MNSKNLFKILISLFCITSNMLSAQSNLDKGWSAFLKNNRKEAHDYFIKASAESASVAESYLALAFIEEVDGKNDAAFKNFQAFFKASQNPYPYLFALWHTPIIFSYQPKLNDNQLDFLKSILVDPKANGTLKAMAHSTIGRHFQATNNVSKARAEFDKIGSSNPCVSVLIISISLC